MTPAFVSFPAFSSACCYSFVVRGTPNLWQAENDIPIHLLNRMQSAKTDAARSSRPGHSLQRYLQGWMRYNAEFEKQVRKASLWEILPLIYNKAT